MELTALEKDLVVAILNRADGEDMEEIVERSNFQGHLTRSLMLSASSTDIKNISDERNELIKRRITLALDDVEELRRILPIVPCFEDIVQRALSNI